MYTCIKLLVPILLLAPLAAPAQSDREIWWTTFDNNQFKVQQVGFSSDSKYIAVGYNKGTVRVFTTDSGFVEAKYDLHEGHVYTTIFQPGTTNVASGDKHGVVLLYDFRRSKELYRLQAHEKPVTAMAFSRDGKLLATGSKDHTIKVWEAATGKLRQTLHYSEPSKVQSLYLDEEKQQLIAGITSLSSGIRIYSLATGIEKDRLGVGNLEHFDVAPDGYHIAEASLNKEIHLYNTKRGNVTEKVFKGHKRWVSDVCYNNTGSILFSGSNDNYVFAWKYNGAYFIRVAHMHNDIDVVHCSPDGRYLAILTTGGEMSVQDVEGVEKEMNMGYMY